MFDRNVLAVSAGIAFVLSAMAGIAGGVPVMKLLFRALAWAVAFAAFSVAAMTLIRRYLPELLPDRTGPHATPEPGTGTGVNIVLPEERPDEFAYQDEGELDAASSDGEEPDELDGDIVEEVTETARRNRGDDSAGGGYDEESSGLSFAPGYAGDDADVEELDVESGPDALPDLDSFSDTFSGSVGSIEDGPVRGGGSRTGDEQDPVIMAKAVRTILKKDQEGSR